MPAGVRGQLVEPAAEAQVAHAAAVVAAGAERHRAAQDRAVGAAQRPAGGGAEVEGEDGAVGPRALPDELRLRRRRAESKVVEAMMVSLAEMVVVEDDGGVRSWRCWPPSSDEIEVKWRARLGGPKAEEPPLAPPACCAHDTAGAMVNGTTPVDPAAGDQTGHHLESFAALGAMAAPDEKRGRLTILPNMVLARDQFIALAIAHQHGSSRWRRVEGNPMGHSCVGSWSISWVCPNAAGGFAGGREEEAPSVTAGALLHPRRGWV